jgi:hypothetical protein
MKLQTNLKGSWRDVSMFAAADAPEVEDAAAMLARAHGGLKLRIVDDDGEARHLNSRGVFRRLGQGAVRG